MSALNGVLGILTGRGPACDELQAWVDQLPLSVQRVRIPGNQIAWQRNQVVKAMDETDAEWVLYVDADCVPQTGALQSLLSTGLMVVSGVVVERVAPFDVCAVKTFEPHTRWTVREVMQQAVPFPVPAVGTGCLLIRREVFEKIPAPWFRCGQINPEVLAEDLDFSLRANEAGFPTYLHPQVLVGHRTDVILWPGRQGDLQAQWPGAGERLPWREALSDKVRPKPTHEPQHREPRLWRGRRVEKAGSI